MQNYLIWHIITVTVFNVTVTVHKLWSKHEYIRPALVRARAITQLFLRYISRLCHSTLGIFTLLALNSTVFIIRYSLKLCFQVRTYEQTWLCFFTKTAFVSHGRLNWPSAHWKGNEVIWKTQQIHQVSRNLNPGVRGLWWSVLPVRS